MRSYYVEECLDASLDSDGLVLRKEVTVWGFKRLVPVDKETYDRFIEGLTFGLDMYSEASGSLYIPNPLQTELKEVRAKSEKEMRSVQDAFERERKSLHDEIRSLRIQLRNALEKCNG